MVETLRHLILQQGARLQGRPALTCPEWGTLSYMALRNRVEGLALGLAAAEFPNPLHCDTGTPWDWVAELAAATCGLVWEPGAPALAPSFLGGPRFQDEAGRQVYHDRDEAVQPTTPFAPGLTQGEVLLRLKRANRRLGWDHATVLEAIPGPGDPQARRAVLWSAFFAGAHVRCESWCPFVGEGSGKPPAKSQTPVMPPLQGFWNAEWTPA